jgi:hypothetical protein
MQIQKLIYIEVPLKVKFKLAVGEFLENQVPGSIDKNT